MERDKQITKEILKNLKKDFVYPAVFYHEDPKGTITLAVVLYDKNTAIKFTSSGTMYLNPAHYRQVKDVFRLSINSQNDEALYVVDNALEEDVQRILNKMNERIPLDFSV